MNVMIKSVNSAAGRDWLVVLGKQRITFHSETEARQFVRTLKARLNAPHVLPPLQRAEAS